MPTWHELTCHERMAAVTRPPRGARRGLRAASARSRPWWAIAPKVFEIGGIDREVYLVGALAVALGVSPVTIRRWERARLLPPAPLRFEYPEARHTTRVYTERMIQIAAEAGEHHDVAAGRPPSAVFTQEVANAWQYEVDALGLRSTVLRLRPSTD